MAIKLNKYQQTNRKKKVQTDASNGIIDFLNQDISFGGHRFNNKKKEQFYTDLSTLLNAGLDLNASLQLLSEEQDKADNIYAQINKDVLVGKPLALALENTQLFTKYEYQSIRIGEETGKLANIMLELKKYFENKNALRSQFIGLITYPIIVIFIAFGVLFFLMNFVVPMFIGFLKQVDAELPSVTQFVLDLSSAFSEWYKPVLGVLVIILAFFYFQRKTEWYRKYSGIVLLKIPIVGKMMQRVYLTRFCQSMSLLTKSKVQLIEALNMTAQMVDFYPIEQSLQRIEKSILKGNTLYDSMREESVFEKRMVSMIRVGEEVNKLDEIFAKLTAQYSDSVESQSKLLKSIVEPILIIVVGGVVALVAMAMILPIFKMSSSMEF
ncbi:MAG: type II secretion system F family protein [Flavobacteriales bacterium]|nr:type II secretion system F family protein [Flavobacteriales bacterium]